MQICCNRLTISISLSLSFSFFCLRRGVATPAAAEEAFAKLAAAGLCGCSCFAALGSLSRSRSLACLRSDVEDPGETFEGGFGAAPEGVRLFVPGAGERLSRVVFDRPMDSEDLGAF